LFIGVSFWICSPSFSWIYFSWIENMERTFSVDLTKAFYMVFMRVILYFICLAPSSLVVCFSTNAFTSETCRTVRFGMYLFLQMTSFLN
jgi:hypothetical protein